MTRILLLDIDGVLVKPGGYRAALRATVNYFIRPHFEIEEKTLEDLERRGISSEWDMSPLLVAAYWDSILARQPMNLPADVFSAAKLIERQSRENAPAHLSVPEFALAAGQYPAETAFRAGCFASIPFELRKNLLTQTRNVRASHPMRVFQHFTLGSEKFSETYNLPAEFETESYLLTHDASNIDDSIRAALMDFSLAAFTARPSAPPREVTAAQIDYAPEAELALELVGMEKIPLIAFGKLEYLAAQYQLEAVELVKPSPIQALAAIAAAWTGDEWAALQAAAEWKRSGKIDGAFAKLPRAFDLIVVEDTIGGIRSVKAAGEILQNAGLNVNVLPLGLTSGSAAKAEAFVKAGIPYFENWGEIDLKNVNNANNG
ncbi:MAG: hypothetical protein PHQ36_14420 [Anaerolineales bacterium]|nr:hypothetical protein [Anaerolineales bacterium]